MISYDVNYLYDEINKLPEKDKEDLMSMLNLHNFRRSKNFYYNSDRQIELGNSLIHYNLNTPTLIEPDSYSFKNSCLFDYNDFQYNIYDVFPLMFTIEEDHSQYNEAFNVFRRYNCLPSIELKIGNRYMLRLGKSNAVEKVMILKNIIWNNMNFPDLYFAEKEDSKGTNIVISKVLYSIKENDENN